MIEQQLYQRLHQTLAYDFNRFILLLLYVLIIFRFQASNYRLQSGLRETPSETKASRRATTHQPLQPNISFTFSTDESSYPWHSWQGIHLANSRKDIETWWTNQLDTSN